MRLSSSYQSHVGSGARAGSADLAHARARSEDIVKVLDKWINVRT